MFRMLLILCGLLAVTASAVRGQTVDTPIAPELAGLGTLHVPVTTPVPRAQRFFDQGMRLLYAFNHAEAIRAFREAARLDPGMAMADWGRALALGPNLNAPMTAESARQAYAAIRQAQGKVSRSTPRERALVEALSVRYAADGAGDRPALDRAYAAAMQKVAARFPADPDITTVYADAQMNTMPWDYWLKDGSPKPETAQVITTLESILRQHPDHPGALHYHIHVMEASNDPDRAVASADRLGPLMPAAGHMVHMPAHIYIRVGRYADAAEANVRAIRADEDYLAQCQAQGLYPVSYYPHNLHFLWAAATLEGRKAAAVEAARTVAAKVPHHHAGALAWTADFPVTPLLAYVRFGLWQEVLTEPKPPAKEPYAIGIWHYARGLAFIARSQIDRGATELTALQRVMKHEAFTSTLKDLPLLTNLQIAFRVVEGELAARRGDSHGAIEALRQAVRIEDGLPYSEPPTWHQPARQVLGALLLEAGRATEAETVYREDLRRFRENGWSLFGLMESLKAQSTSAEAAADKHRASDVADVRRRFEKAWARSDIRLVASRVLGDAHAAPLEKSVALSTGTTLAYVEQGDADGTPLVLLHGYTDSWRSFERVLPHLPRSLRVFAVTQRGHGDSGKPAEGYAPEHFARDLAAFMDATGIERAVVAGHSGGSIVAQRFAVDYPQRTVALVLEGAFLPRPGNAGVAELWGAVSTLTDPIDPAFVRGFQQSTLAQPVPPSFFDTAVRESLKVPARVWKAALAPYLTFDFAAELGAIRVPALIVWGDRDTFGLRSEQDALASAIPHSRVLIYSGAGHSPHWEEPDRFASDLSAFIEQLTRR